MPLTNLSESERRTADAVIAALNNPKTNGKREEETERRRPRFNGEINLGHVLTILTMGCALATMWVNGRVTMADHETRIKALEAAQLKMEEKHAVAFEKLTEATRQAMDNQARISVALEYITKGAPKQ